jgi:hypothetical protein
MKTLLTTLFVTLTLVGCSGSAQLLRKDTVGGSVALQGPFMPAMREARGLMAEHCHGRFEAVEHGRSVEFRCRDAAATGDAQLALASEARGN